MTHKIVKLIPRDRYISRSELAQAAGASDRYVRRQIEEARRAGYMIVSNTRQGGYKIASNGAEWMEFVERERQFAMMPPSVRAALDEAMSHSLLSEGV